MLRLPFHTLLALLALALAAPPAQAGEDLPLDRLLAERGVRLVVVEFYATWCAPCMAAMPRWKALKEKYKGKGLRVVVVNTQDPDGGCRALPFVPDETVCDISGRVAQSFGLQGKLPAAFLWSWQGNLLVQAGHVDAVEAQVEHYLTESPRVLVQPGKDVPPAVAAAVRERLSDDGKVQVVAGEAEAKLVDAAKRAQAGARYDEKLQCALGQEVPANAILKVEQVGSGKDKYLNLGLYDLQGGCLLQNASIEWDSRDAKRMVSAAVSKLVRKLQRDRVQMPGTAVAKAPEAAPAGPPPKKIETKSVREDEKAVDLGGDDVVVEFTSEPKGVVRVDGKLLCQVTPCKKEVAVGSHDVEIEAESYVSEKKAVSFGPSNRRFDAKLLPDFAVLTVTTEPTGLKLQIAGEAAEAPVTGKRLAPGKAHTIKLMEPCYLGAEEQFAVARGENKVVALQARIRKAGLRVKAEDDKGDAAVVEVKVDGSVVGQTPWKGEVSVCAKELTVGGKGQALKLEEGKVQELKVIVASKKEPEPETVTVAERKPATGGRVAAPGAGWVRIAPGTFVMGSPEGEIGRNDDEGQHKVTITRPFLLKATEVTQIEWRGVMGINPSRYAVCGTLCPVDNVTWDDAVKFCNKLSQREGLQQCYVGDRFVGLQCTGYRLPTEAEWEYAARAGTTGSRYSGVDAVSWHQGNSESKPHAVGTKQPNAWGLYDMLGNVWEWTHGYSGDYAAQATDPTGPETGDRRMVRGGSWGTPGAQARAACRNDYDVAGRDPLLGLRPARTIAPFAPNDLLRAEHQTDPEAQAAPQADLGHQKAELRALIAKLRSDRAAAGKVMATLAKLADVCDMSGDPKGAAAAYTEILGLFTAGRFAKDGGIEATAAAQATYGLLKPRYDAFMASRLVANGRLLPAEQFLDLQNQVKALMDTVLGPEVAYTASGHAEATDRCGNCPDDEARCRRWVCNAAPKANGLYDEYLQTVASFGAQDWTSAAHLARPRLLMRFAQLIYGAPRPAGMPDEVAAVYEEFLARLGRGYEERAVQSLRWALGNADAHHVQNHWVTEIRAELAKYKPEQATVPAPAKAQSPPPTTTTPTRVEDPDDGAVPTDED